MISPRLICHFQVFGNAPPSSMMEKFSDLLQFTTQVSRQMVTEIRRRASNKSTGEPCDTWIFYFSKLSKHFEIPVKIMTAFASCTYQEGMGPLNIAVYVILQLLLTSRRSILTAVPLCARLNYVRA